jgi:hypothetical protein
MQPRSLPSIGSGTITTPIVNYGGAKAMLAGSRLSLALS